MFESSNQFLLRVPAMLLLVLLLLKTYLNDILEKPIIWQNMLCFVLCILLLGLFAKPQPSYPFIVWNSFIL